MTYEPTTLDLARRVLDAARAKGAMVATAESCTGGLVAGVLTAIAGSSDVVDRGFVTYSNGAKRDLLGVPDDMLAAHGAVSEPVARAMAEGARQRAGVAATVAITGIAGPGGGTPTKPVGRVHIAAATAGGVIHERFDFGDVGRDAVRHASVDRALELLLRALETLPMGKR